MPRPEEDPFWRSGAVRAALLWIATGLVASICGVLYGDHERQAETRMELALVRMEVASLNHSMQEIRSVILGQVATHGNRPAQPHP